MVGLASELRELIIKPLMKVLNTELWLFWADLAHCVINICHTSWRTSRGRGASVPNLQGMAY